MLKAIPGLKLVEMAYNRQLSMCCGGGGNVEMVNPELSAKVARDEAQDNRRHQGRHGGVLLPAVPENHRHQARRDKVNLVVKDLTELIFEAMDVSKRRIKRIKDER